MNSRIDQSVANLLNIIKEQDQQIKLLADLISNFIKGGHILESTSVVTIQDLEDLIDYLNEYAIDYLVLFIPGTFPQAYDREELDKASEAGALESWIREQWKEETVALAI